MDWMDNDVIFLRLITALGIRVVRVPDLGEPYRLYPPSRVALVDTSARPEDWDNLAGLVLTALPVMER